MTARQVVLAVVAVGALGGLARVAVKVRAATAKSRHAARAGHPHATVSGEPPATSSIVAAANVCANEPLATKGAHVSYVCDCGPGADRDCKPGADSNPGTATAPWRSYGMAVAAFAKLSAGDTLAFCRGGSFTGGGEQWVNPTCRAATPCTVRDYRAPWASGDEAAPRLVVSSLSLANGGAAEHEEGYRFLNLHLVGKGAGDGVFVHNDVKDVLLCNLTIEGFAVGVNIQASNPPGPGSDGLNARIVVRGSRILRNTGIGWLGACNGCAVEDSFFDYNGGANELDHSIYVGGASTGTGQSYTTTGIRIVGNRSRHAARGPGSVCMGAPIVVHGRHDGLRIEGNDIAEELDGAGPGCWGIAVMTAYSDAEAFTHVTVSKNVVVNTGNTGIEVEACSACVIENNLVVHGQSDFGTRGITAGDAIHRTGPGDLPMQGVQVRNNTVYVGGNGADPSTGITVGFQGAGHVVTGNAVLNAAKGRFTCFDRDLAPAAYRADRNVCFSETEQPVWDAHLGSLEETQRVGLDAHSLLKDPRFKRAAVDGYDFTPAAGSPLLGAGQPDIGALQHPPIR